MSGCRRDNDATPIDGRVASHARAAR